MQYPSIEIRFPDGHNEIKQLTRERTVVGRSKDADIRIVDNRVSREHCALEVRGSQLFVIDLGGSNGTWIGATKLLANVQEPFPYDAVVHVGPAQLRNVTSSDFDPKKDLESQAYMPVAPERPAVQSPLRAEPVQRQARPSAQPGARIGTAGQSAAAVELSTTVVSVNPGERAGFDLAITNQSKIVDHYTLSLVGLQTTWVTLPVAGVELLPRQSGSLRVDLHPPRHPRTTAGSYPISIALLNRDGQIVTEVAAELIVGAFDNMALDIRPNPLQARSSGTMNLTVENHGNAETDYRVDVIEPSDYLEVWAEPTTATVAPQQSRNNAIHIRPRKRNWFGQPVRSTLTVTVTSSQQSVNVSPTFTHLNLIPRWLPMILGLMCCIIIPLFAFLAWPEIEPALFPTDTPVPTATPENTPTPTPDFAATQTATRAIWLELDDDGDGLTNGEEVELKTLPGSKDTDGDSLSDFEEVKRFNTDPTNHDTDGDTLPDGVEALDPCKSPENPDTDNDGIPDNLDPDSCVGLTPTPSPVPDFALGGQVNNSLEHLDVLEDARMSWVKIQLRYSPGANPQSTMQDVAKYKQEGYKVLLSVVGDREQIAGGLGFMQGFANFLGDIAPIADGIEVWNEPNLDREWPTGEIDPADYTEMLRLAYSAIKSTNPATIVISAAPSPTGTSNAGAMPDDRFIAGMFNAGAKQYMDCLGIHFNVGATPASATSGHPFDNNGHYSWYYPTMVETYYGTFNPPDAAQQVPLCFTEIGYLSPDGFDLTLAQAGATNFLFGEGTSVREQAEWLEESLLLACRSGKVKLFIVWNVDFANYGQDPQAGYAILRPNERCPSCETLSRAVGILRTEGCMS